jgi:hypothetical protein
MILDVDIDDKDTGIPADLGRSEPDTLVLVHQLKHPSDTGTRCVIGESERVTAHSQHRIGVVPQVQIRRSSEK